ncbi:hypothetical protein [Kordiimonas laminariae]|uniref:hypothetical protein n=1 Tax=Kordiimonas laminariae TaxID=2917717 RepID=UPI001FF2167E|nr:hypothetical protein [Kordiimonas laminariae]MCK0070957.1 hypothetical protein [Kordiimonas laminariae]
MIKALNTAQNGLLQAERRATEIARDILNSTSAASSSFSDAVESSPSENTSTEAPTTAQTVNNTNLSGASVGSLIQQFADLRAEEQSFAANAKAFQAIDETLGSLLDDEG